MTHSPMRRGGDDDAVDYPLMIALRQAGFVARALQGKVSDEGKPEATALPNDDDALRARRAAKTVVDEIVQDLLLVAAGEVFGSHLDLDAEEDTVMRALFGGDRPIGTLVVDPVDGTIDYVNGRDSYSICLGLVANGDLVPAYVYFAAKDRLYYVSSAGVPYQVERLSTDGLRHRQVLKPSAGRPANVVYINGRVPVALQSQLRAAGYDVRDDTVDNKGAADCLVACIEGKAICYISHTRQVRDVMLGAVVGSVEGGFAHDWRGRRLAWPGGGRIPGAVFGVGPPPEDLTRALAAFAPTLESCGE